MIDTTSVCSFHDQTLRLSSDYLLNMFSHRNLSLYGGHDDEINCLVFSSDFEILLTGSISGFIRIWNTVDDHLTLKVQEQTGKWKRFQLMYENIYIP